MNKIYPINISEYFASLSFIINKKKLDGDEINEIERTILRFYFKKRCYEFIHVCSTIYETAYYYVLDATDADNKIDLNTVQIIKLINDINRQRI